MNENYAPLMIQQWLGDPTGHVTPIYKGCLCLDRVTTNMYQSTGFANTSWKLVGGGGGPAIGTTIVGPDVVGAAAVVGTGPNYSPVDHDHGLPTALSFDVSIVPGGFYVGSAAPALEGHARALNESAGVQGFSAVLTSLPFTVSPGGIVCSLPSVDVATADTTVGVGMTLQGTIFVTDLTNTNVLQVNQQDVTGIGPNETLALDWATATPTTIAGADLAYGTIPNQVTSTAGGVFVVSMKGLFYF